MGFSQFLKQEISKLTHQKILLIDAGDSRAEAAALLLAQHDNITPVLLFNTRADKKRNFDQIETLFLDEISEQEMDYYCKKYVEYRKNKETYEQAQAALKSRINFAMMLLREKKVQGVVGGLLYPTADILRGSFKIIGPKPGIKTISSVMVMHQRQETFIFTDISVNPNPTSEQLVDIAKNAYDFAKSISLPPKTAFLSFSTKGSAVTSETIKVAEATKMYNQTAEGEAAGEIQFDAAFDEEIRKSKYKELVYNDSATIYVFPNLDSGNIGYKIAQRLGKFGAIGPILTGINGAVNDLSRGATIEDVYNTSLITALQAANLK